MGYSIAVKIRSPKVRAKVLTFFGRNFRSSGMIFGRAFDYASELRSGYQLGYEKNTQYVGFDYKPVGEDDEYAHALTRWIAIRVGVRRKNIPVIRYNGYELIDVPPKWYDEHGWFTRQYYTDNPRMHELLVVRARPEALQAIQAELHRLSALWGSGDSPC